MHYRAKPVQYRTGFGLYVRREEATFTNSLLYYIGSISQCSIKIILYALLSTLMVYIEQEIYTIIEL